jgi:TRAP-type C4-dicarboxylate transport system substrate-binding protein
MLGNGFRDMVFREAPVTTVEGMKGLRMRAPEAHVWIRMFELLGARPVPITWVEVYTGLQTGVADGLDGPALAILDIKVNEVTKALVKTQHMFTSMCLTINEDRFSSLSEEDRDAISEAATEATSWSSQYAREQAETAYGGKALGRRWRGKGVRLGL